MRKEGNVICLLVRKRREQLSYAAVNRSIMEKAVCFAVSLNGADSGANRSKQLSKGTFLRQSSKVREQSIGWPSRRDWEPLPRTFDTKLMHFVVYSWELNQPRGSTTIPNHNDICIIRQSQDQESDDKKNDDTFAAACSLHGVSAQALIDPENLSMGWFCLANIPFLLSATSHF